MNNDVGRLLLLDCFLVDNLSLNVLEFIQASWLDRIKQDPTRLNIPEFKMPFTSIKLYMSLYCDILIQMINKSYNGASCCDSFVFLLFI